MDFNLKMPNNTAAWLKAPKAPSLEVKSAPYTSPKQNEIVVRNHAVAINPIDWVLKDLGNIMFTWLKYPFIVSFQKPFYTLVVPKLETQNTSPGP